jgi:protein-S-isoprenylcysteine O-methyltransferase Ste14
MTERHKIVPPIYFVLSLLAMSALHYGLPIATIIPAPLNLLGIAFVVAGLVSTFWAAGMFRRLGTPVRPFEPSTTLATGGMYRITRNPMYLGMTLFLTGTAVWLGTLSPFLPIPLFVWQIQRKFVRPEEEFLEDIFGQEYRAYKARVRRWL